MARRHTGREPAQVAAARPGRRARRRRGRSARPVRPDAPPEAQSSEAANTRSARRRLQVAEQRAQGVVEHEGVPGRAAGRSEQHRLAGQRTRLEHVEERLEQPAVRRVEDGRDGDHPSARTTRSTGRADRRRESRSAALSARSWASVAQLDHVDRDASPPGLRRPPVASARRSASSRVEDGWPRPADTTTTAAAHRASTTLDGGPARGGSSGRARGGPQALRGSGPPARGPGAARRAPCAAPARPPRRAGRAAPGPSSAAGRRGR